jgi:hypothetical protein
MPVLNSITGLFGSTAAPAAPAAQQAAQAPAAQAAQAPAAQAAQAPAAQAAANGKKVQQAAPTPSVGGATKKYNGRTYKVRTGSKGGKYILVKGQKKYV